MNFDIISIIVCARGNIQKLRDNIEQTIGVPHKLFVVDNSQNRYSIFEAYNLGLKNNQNKKNSHLIKLDGNFLSNRKLTLATLYL